MSGSTETAKDRRTDHRTFARALLGHRAFVTGHFERGSRHSVYATFSWQLLYICLLLFLYVVSIAAIGIDCGVAWSIYEHRNINTDAMLEFARDVLVRVCFFVFMLLVGVPVRHLLHFISQMPMTAPWPAPRSVVVLDNGMISLY